MAIGRRGRAHGTLNFDDISCAVQFFNDEFTRSNADGPVLSADVTGDFGVHLPVKRDDRNVRLHHLFHDSRKRLSLHRTDD